MNLMKSDEPPFVPWALSPEQIFLPIRNEAQRDQS
jgi:hypothetical protein